MFVRRITVEKSAYHHLSQNENVKLLTRYPDGAKLARKAPLALDDL